MTATGPRGPTRANADPAAAERETHLKAVSLGELETDPEALANTVEWVGLAV